MLGNEGKLVSRLGGNAKYWFHYLQGRLQKNYKKKNKVLICPLVVKDSRKAFLENKKKFEAVPRSPAVATP
jgi:hypothetical protein